MSEVKQLTIPAPMPVVVVIDDEEIVGMVINLSLRRRGYTTIFFNSANEAIAHIADQSVQVDAVITDYSMPEMTGLDLAKELRALRPNLPVVICSGYFDALNPDTAQSLGVAARISKPVNQDSLLQTLKTVIA